MRAVIQIAIALVVSAPMAIAGGGEVLKMVRVASCKTPAAPAPQLALSEQILARLASQVGGSIDKITSSNGLTVIEGWVADLSAANIARSVQIAVNGEVVGAGRALTWRPDVAQAMNLPCAENLEFRVTIQRETTENDRISAYAELWDGSFAALANSQAGVSH
jgi:hypothetical protein